MKRLKFEASLVPLILEGKKRATWRLEDEKDLQEGDKAQFVNAGTGEVFGEARLTKVIEKPYKELTKTDKQGHEEYESEEELFKTFAGYYDRPVDEETVFKVIKFRLLDD